MTVWMTSIEVAPGVPEPSILEQVARALVEPHLGCKPRVTDGLKLDSDTGLGPLVERLESFHNFTARGSKKFEARFGWNRWVGLEPPNTGSVTMFIEDKAADTNDLLKGLEASVAALDGLIGFLSPFEGGMRERRVAHRERVQAAEPGAGFSYGRGFSGVAWRTVLGPHAVDFLGRDALAALPKERASPIGDAAWLLTPCDSHAEWRPDVWCEGERQIIDALGRQRFFDPVTKTLPTEKPGVPAVATIPVKAIDVSAEDEAWEYHNGYPRPRLG